MPVKLNQEIFLERAKSLHGDFYNYKSFVYKNNKTKSIVICPIHMCIEYDGQQHFYVIDNWFGGKKQLVRTQENDRIKTNYCLKNEIRLNRITYKDFKNIESILVKFILGR